MCAPRFGGHQLAVAGRRSSSRPSSAASLILPSCCGGCDQHCSATRGKARLSRLPQVKIHTWPHRTAPSHTTSLLEPRGSCSYLSLRQGCTRDVHVWNRVKPSQTGAELVPVLVTPPRTWTTEPLIAEVLRPNKSGKATLPP